MSWLWESETVRQLKMLRETIGVYHRTTAVTLGRLEILLETIGGRLVTLSEQVEEIRTAVAELSTVAGSAVTLLERLTDLVEANQHDPAALVAVIVTIREEKTKLAVAVSANTPAE
jgi:hypothetical protein